MDERERSPAGREPAPTEATPDAAGATQATSASTAWVATLPPPPFIDPASSPTEPRFAALSPRVAVLIVAAVVLGVVLWMARDAVRPFVLGLLLVYLLEPPVRWLVRRGMRRTFAILLVYVVAIVAIVEMINLTLTPLVNELVQFVQDFPALTVQFQIQIERLSEIYARLQLPDALRDYIDSVIAGIVEGEGGTSAIDFGIFLPVLTGAGSFIGAIFGYVLLPVWVFYILKDRSVLTGQFDRSLPAAWRFDVWAVLRIARRVFGQWVRAQLVLGITVGVFTFIGLSVLSQVVDPVFGRYAILLSVTAGILELVPIIGPIISAIPAVLLAATAGIEPVIAALILYTLVQQIENNLLVPKIQGDAVALHPAAVMFAIIIGGALAGLLGAILALPVTAAARDVIRYLFRRASPGDSTALADSIATLGLETHPGCRTSRGRRPRRARRRERVGSVQGPAGRSRGGGRGDRRRVSTPRPQIPPGYGDRGRVERADGGDQRRVGGARRPGAARRPRSAASAPGGRFEEQRGRSRGHRRSPAAAPSAAHASARPRRVRGPQPRTPEPETVSRDWSSGRSSVGGGYDQSMRTPDHMGAAGQPPGNPSGSVMNFGRYDGWSLGEIARSDLEYLEWLDRMPIGRPYRDEIDAILRQTGRRRSAAAETRDRRGLFRRR